MKKQSLLLITGGILAFASCNSDMSNADDSQAKIDSMVNERVEEIRMELQMKNDSIINELAMYRADSIMAAAKGKRVVRRKPAPPKSRISVDDVPTTSGGAKTEKKNSKADRFNGTESNTDKKAARFSEEAAEKEKQNNAKKKADRFK